MYFNDMRVSYRKEGTRKQRHQKEQCALLIILKPESIPQVQLPRKLHKHRTARTKFCHLTISYLLSDSMKLVISPIPKVKVAFREN